MVNLYRSYHYALQFSCADLFVERRAHMVGSQAIGHYIFTPCLWQEAGSPLSTLEPCPDFGSDHVLNALIVPGALHRGQPGE